MSSNESFDHGAYYLELAEKILSALAMIERGDRPKPMHDDPLARQLYGKLNRRILDAYYAAYEAAAQARFDSAIGISPWQPEDHPDDPAEA